MNKLAVLLIPLLLPYSAFSNIQIRKYEVKTDDCINSLEKTGAIVFECVVNTHPISNEVLVKKDERHLSFSECKITLESTAQGYQMKVTRDFSPRRPLLTLNEAKACLSKAVAVSQLEGLILTSIIADTSFK